MNIRNLTSRTITVKAKSIVARVASAYVVPLILAQENSQKTEEWLDKRTEPPNLNSKMDKDIGFPFALNDLDLRKASTVKHTIKLKDYTPFKERYHRIPPHQFEEVRKHLEEMLEIRAIKCSNSPWPSTVVFV